MLLERLFEVTADDARRGYTLEVRVSNLTAISLYERLGFALRYRADGFTAPRTPGPDRSPFL